MKQLYTDNRVHYDELAPLLKAYPEVDETTEKRLLAIAKQITLGAVGQNEEQA